MYLYNIYLIKEQSDYFSSLSYKPRNNTQQRITIQSKIFKIKKEMALSECTAPPQSIQIHRPLISNAIRLGEIQ